MKKINFYYSLLRRFSKIGKRRRFIGAAVFLSLLMLFSSFLSFQQMLFFLPIMALFVYLAVFFSILEGIDKIEWLMLFIHAAFFTVAFDLFFFLLPARWLTRILFIIIYMIFIYAILLSANIFNVGVVKSLQLFRVAFSVNFLFLTITSFLIFSLILSFKLSFIFDFILILIFIFPMALQFLWSINPTVTLDRQLVKYALLVSLFVAQVGLVFTFMPIRLVIMSLFLTACFYSFLGLFHAFIEKRLFKDRVREFLFVLIFVFVMTILSIKW